METIISGLDEQNNYKIGEKGHIALDWSSKVYELMMQVDFQSVRTTNNDLDDYNRKLNKIYNIIYNDKDINALKMMYKTIGYMRDILHGKGEYNLAYNQILIFYENMKQINEKMGVELTKKMIESFVNMENQHPLGSWKDLKNLNNLIYEKTHNLGNEITDIIINIYIEQLKLDESNMKNENEISLMAKWFPREKSKHNFLFKDIAKELYKVEINTGKKNNKQDQVIKFIYMSLRKRISRLNKYLDTVQIKMCNKDWQSINFKNVTSITLQKQKKSFLNTTKTDNERYEEEDRRLCKYNFEKFINNTETIKGKRCSIYNFVKDTLETYNQTEWSVINKQWADYVKQFNNFTSVIPLVDTSASMEEDNKIPLFNAIGLGVAISERNDDIFKDRIMTFSATPSWITLDREKTFTEKVRKIKNNSDWGYNTNFYSALKLILDVILEKQISPENVENMILVILSDMQIDVAEGCGYNGKGTLFATIEKEYEEAGMRSKYKQPYKTPHILFWNLRKTDNFPVKTETKNTTMISGYNLGVLNKFCENGIESLKEIDPLVNFKETLNNKRYNELDEFFDNMVEKYNNNLFKI